MVLKNKFVICEALNGTSSIYQCLDKTNQNEKFLIKLSPNTNRLNHEMEVLEDIKKHERTDKYNYQYDYITEVIDKGEFSLKVTGKQKLYSYYIMKKQGPNIQTIFGKMNQKFSTKTVMQIGIKLLEIFQKVHSSGYLYNNLNLKHILVGRGDSREIRLSAFQLASKFEGE